MISQKRLCKCLAVVALLLFSYGAFAQTVVKSVLTGTVTDTSGGPLPGAAVLVAAEKLGAITDSDGNYAIADVPIGAEVSFSMAGMKTCRVVFDGSRLDIILEDDIRLLSDAVVVGYGTLRKEELTSSVAKVDESSFNSGVVTSPINLISGKVPGLIIRNTAGSDPNASPEIQLRGVGSVRAGSTPLIIIDGAYSSISDLNAISPSEIKSFNVLKDGASAAIYGTQGSNGVIIVETKNADRGRRSIEYTNYLYFETPVRMLELLSADEYMTMLCQKGLSASDNDYGYSTDWQSRLLRNNLSSFYGISFSNSHDDSSVRASLGYRDSESMVINTGSSQLNARVSFRQDFFDKKLTVSGQANGSVTESQYTDYGAFMQALVYNPTAPVHTPDGKWFEFAGVGPYNPVALLSQVGNRGKTYNFNGSLTATLHILPSLKWVVMAASNVENGEASKYVERDSRYCVLSNIEGEASMSSHFYGKNTLETYADYSFDLNGHHATFMAGYSYHDTHRVWNNAMNTGFMTDELGVNNIGNGTALEEGRAVMGRGEDESRLVAFFGRVNYSYSGKYLFNASLRREGSTRFGENNKWGWFPAVSAAWRISEEDFMKHNGVVNELKLRAGYGLTGNQDIPLYQSISKYNNLGYAWYDGGWHSVYGPVTNPNPDLRWEKNAEYNVGVDLGLWDDRLSLSTDVYYRKTTDLLDWYSAQTPSSIYSTIFTNVGSMVNKGVEFSLGYDIVRNEDFNWHVDVAGSYNRNVLLSLSNDTYKANHIPYNTLSSPANGQNTYILDAGKSIGTFYGYKYKGLTEEGKWVFEDVTPDGVTDELDYTYLGCGLPVWNYSISSTMNWKGMDFSFQLRGAAGFDVLNVKRLYYENTVSLPFNLLRSAYGTRISDAATFSDFYLEKGDYLKLSNLTVGYTFDFGGLKYLNSLRVYATAGNLFTLTGYTGVDPETGSGLTPGFDDSGYFPRSATFLFGINLKF